jgi:uncharacterized membrane protein
VECPRSESIFVVGRLRKRLAAVSERGEFFERRAGAISARRCADSANSTSANGSSLEHEQRIAFRAAFEFEQRGKQHASENSDSAAREFAAIDLRVEHEYDTVALAVADLQRERSSAATLRNHRLDQFRAFERHL